LSGYDEPSTPPPVLIVTILAAIGVCTGGFFGGTLVYQHGTGVAVEAGGADGRDRATPDQTGTAAGPVAKPVIIRRARARRGDPVRHRNHRGQSAPRS
jgi:hypothetical protein